MKITLNQLRRIIKEEVQKTMDEMGAPRAKLPGAPRAKLPGAPRAKLPGALSRMQKKAFRRDVGIDLDSPDNSYPYTWDESTSTLSLAWDEAEPGEDQQYTKYIWNANEEFWEEVYVED